MSFNVFPVVAILPEALHRAVPGSRAVALLALGGALIIFSGGYTIVFVYALTALLLATYLPLAQPGDYRPRTIILRLIAGSGGTIAIAAAKITAVALFLSHFPRLVDYRFAGRTGLEMPSLLWQLFGRRTFLGLSRWLPFTGDELNSVIGRGEDVGFGIVTALVLAAGAVLLIRHAGSARAERDTKWQWAAAIVVTWIVIEFMLGKGVLWPFLKPLPFLRSLHENHRLAAAFALPVALATAPAWSALMRNRRPVIVRMATIVVIAGTLCSVECYFRSRASFWHGSYSTSVITKTWDALRRNPDERFVIERVADVPDDASFLAHASSWKPYEPIFGYGYGGPEFRIRFQPGKVELTPDLGGSWRFDHPLSFVDPALAGVAPFQPMPASERRSMEMFLQRHQPAWPLPPMQHVANWLTLLGLAAAVAMLFWRTSDLAVRPACHAA
jgi:hypothetical protein